MASYAHDTKVPVSKSREQIDGGSVVTRVALTEPESERSRRHLLRSVDVLPLGPERPWSAPASPIGPEDLRVDSTFLNIIAEHADPPRKADQFDIYLEGKLRLPNAVATVPDEDLSSVCPVCEGECGGGEGPDVWECRRCEGSGRVP